MNEKPVTVTQINRYINNKMKLDEQLSDINIRGEISNYKTYPSGHSYFTLKDKNSQISAVMFYGFRQYLKFEPKDGMKVIIRGNIEVYEKNGQYQLHAKKITEDGLGELHIAYEQLKKKLDDEGLFDESHKKQIPRYPKRIGAVTAQTGAAIRDIITTIKRRYPLCEVLVFSTLVQGDLAKFQIVEQIQKADGYDLDTLIVGRGGGSIEDLWPFNEEIVARAIFECETPVISAVGHEIDFTISDFVADLRAATPTAAAERAVPDIKELKDKVKQYNIRANNSINEMIFYYKNRLEDISNKQLFKSPTHIYDIKRMHLDNLLGRFDYISKNIINENRNKLFKLENSPVLRKPDSLIDKKKERFIRNLGKLEILNPLLTLKRGYSIAKKEDTVVSSVKDVNQGDELIIRFDDGEVNTKVI
ncbi:MAG: exodeoxyribonuclease VII large subunit [Methanosphaera sp.]|nr:exodeoxyribonuclease VII large subunit [Methanosphaera sp.]